MTLYVTRSCSSMAYVVLAPTRAHPLEKNDNVFLSPIATKGCDCTLKDDIKTGVTWTNGARMFLREVSIHKGAQSKHVIAH